MTSLNSGPPRDAYGSRSTWDATLSATGGATFHATPVSRRVLRLPPCFTRSAASST
jgi:hypothetical protein